MRRPLVILECAELPRRILYTDVSGQVPVIPEGAPCVPPPGPCLEHWRVRSLGL